MYEQIFTKKKCKKVEYIFQVKLIKDKKVDSMQRHATQSNKINMHSEFVNGVCMKNALDKIKVEFIFFAFSSKC